MLATAFIRAFHLGLLLAGAVLALDHPIEQGEPAISRASPFLAHNPASPPSARSSRLVERTNEKYVFAQFIKDMKLAMDIGIDAFFSEYRRAGNRFFDNVDFKVFISFDSAYWRNEDINTMAAYVQNYATRPGQVMYPRRGDRFPYRTLESQLEDGLKLFACPNWEPDSFVNNDDTNGPDCGMSWNAAPYRPGSPSTHYGDDTYNKNWIFYSDWLYQSRWDEILTRNDFGESHYIGPLHDDDWSVYAGGSGDTGFPHDAWRDVAKVYISAFKSGASSPTVTTDKLVYYYRPTPKDTPCSDDIGRPNGWQYDDDLVFVIAMLVSPGTVTIASGSENAPVQFQLDAGIHTVAGAHGAGKAELCAVERGRQTSAGTGDGGLEFIISTRTLGVLSHGFGALPSSLVL
ncbi:glycoside hydrolase family 71 protein [Mycena olivaceomarginata]|nr:glycoside hydrolase family 71 protein [Mycena olivaceomarginata]